MTTILLTDSMDKIQKKLNKGGDICFQKGIYKITKQLIIKDKSYITLNGSTLRRCGNIQSIFLNDCTHKTKGYKGAGNITILNGTFEGMGSYNPDNLLTFFHSHDIHIEGVTFLDNLCHDIEINSSKNVEIINCYFFGSNTKEKYQECIQIDAAYAKGFWKSGSTVTSKCYDGTMCDNIKITHCEFNKSKYRTNPSACIGTHTQLQGGLRHKNILIANNEFVCDGTGYCLSLIGMENVHIYSNYFKKCGRVARIYSKDYSYDLQGNQVEPKDSDGVCKYIEFMDNVESDYIGTNKCSGIYAIAEKDPHDTITVISNRFDKSNNYEKYYLVADHCINVVADKNRTKLKTKITP